MKGIDGSHWLACPLAADLKAANIGFVLWKGTEGMTWGPDPTIADARAKAAAAGCQFGLYHLGRNDGSGLDQWKRFLSDAKPQDSDIVALDIEAGPSISPDRAREWMTSAEVAWWKPIAYGLAADNRQFSADQRWTVTWAQYDGSPAAFKQTGQIPIGGGSYDLDSYDTAFGDFGQYLRGGDMDDARVKELIAGFVNSNQSITRLNLRFVDGMRLFDSAPDTDPATITNPNVLAGFMFAKQAGSGGGGLPSHKHPTAGDTGDAEPL